MGDLHLFHCSKPKGFTADTGEVEFEESSDISVAVAERVLPSSARTGRLTCVLVAGDSMEPTEGGGLVVVVDSDRRVAVDDQLFVVSIVRALAVKRFRQFGGQWHFGQRWLGPSAEAHESGRSHRRPGGLA